MRGALIVPGDPEPTAANVLASECLLRANIAADAVVAVSDVALGFLLQVLLRAVKTTVALVAAAFRLAQTAILGMNLLNLHMAMSLLTGYLLIRSTFLRAP